MGSDVRHVRGEAQKELVKKFEVFSSNGRSRWQVWSDWITMSAIAVSNATDRSHFDEREKQYLSIAGKYTRPEIPAILSKDCGPQGHSFGANRREMGSGFAAIWCVSISAIIGQNWNFMAGGYGGRTERPSSSGNAAGVKKRNILCASARSYPQC